MADGFLTIDPDPAWKQMKKLGKGLFACLGDLRDTQVMSEWIVKLSDEDDLVRHSLLRTLQQKETQQKIAAEAAVRSFDRKQWSSLNEHLAGRTEKVPLESLVFQHLALERWLDAHALHRQALRNRSGASYHQLRIGIKRFRYTVENFLPVRHERWSKDLRNLQDALGEVHDFDVLWAKVRAHTEVAAADRLRWQTRISTERQKRLDFYRKKMLGRDSLWQLWRGELPSGGELQRAAIEKLKTWAAFLDPDFSHASLVTKLSLQIYDALGQQAAHTTNPADRGLLETAAILHEIGRSKGDRGHHKRGYKMIRKLSAPVGWSEDDLHAVAIIARYHRGPLAPASNALFAGIGAKRRSELLTLAGVLRLANAFDLTHDGQIPSVTVENREGMLVIAGPGFEEISPLAERIARRRYLLEVTSGIPIAIRPLAPRRSTAAVPRLGSRGASVSVG
jgi:CHAD domain-containing protein